MTADLPIRTREDVVQWIRRRGQVVEVVKKEVLARNRRAMIVYGDGHFMRNGRWVGSPAGNPTVVTRLEQHGVKMFSIWTNTTVQLERLQRDIASWPIPRFGWQRVMKGSALKRRRQLRR